MRNVARALRISLFLGVAEIYWPRIKKKLKVLAYAYMSLLQPSLLLPTDKLSYS